MGIYDLLVLGLVLATTFFGWRKGLSTQIASIVSIMASFAVAVRFREPVAEHIDAAEPWNKFAAMLLLYLGTSLVIWLFFRQVQSSIHRMRLGEFDRQMGAVFGALKGVALASVITLFAFTLLEEPQREAIIHSKSGVWIARLIHSSTAIMPPEVLQFVGPYLEQLDQGFGPYRNGDSYARPTDRSEPGGWDPWNSRPSNSDRNRSESYPPPPPSQAYDYRPANRVER